MRILLVVHHFPPDVNSTGLLMARLFGDLATDGHDVTVITTFPHYEGFRTWPQYRGRLLQRDTYRGMRVRRVYSYTSGQKTMVRRLINYLTFNAAALTVGLFQPGPFDIVFCTNGSFFSGITGYVLSKVKRARFVYNLQDLYPDVPVRQGQLRNRAAIAALEIVEKFMYRRADRLAVIAPSFQDHVAGKGVPRDKVVVIPNFVDTEFVRPLPKDNAFSAEHGLADRFVVSHAGNIGYVYDLHSLLLAAGELATLGELLFLVVGDGVARPELEAAAREQGLTNVRFLPFQPWDRVPWLRAASDVQVALYKRGSASFSMPSKVYEIMASGRPVVAGADRDSDLWRLVEELGCGLCVEPEDPAGLAAAIRRLYGDPALRDEMGARGRAAAENNYSVEAVRSRYLATLKAISGDGF